MTEPYIRVVELEQKLLTAWLTRPSLRAAWTPAKGEMLTPKSQALAGACVMVADLEGDDLTQHAMAALAETGSLKLWAIGEPVSHHERLSDPLASLRAWREESALLRLTKALREAGQSDTLAKAVEAATAAVEAAVVSGDAKTFTERQLLQVALEESTRKDRATSYSGFTDLDVATGGLRKGHIWVLGAPTNWGKTSWLLALADRSMLVNKRGVLYVTCEDDPVMIGQRLLSRRTGASGRATRDGKLSPADLKASWEQVAAASDAVLMLDGRGRSVETLAGDIRMLVREHRVELVLVDYLQCITTLRETDDRRGEINHIARTLTDVVKTSGAAGVFASQLTGEDIRESRDVEHAAEVVLIGRKSESGDRSMFVKKNKTGPNGFEFELSWNTDNGSFRTHDIVEDYRFDNEA